MKQDKFLMGILIGIVLLIVASVGIYFSRRGTPLYYQSEDQPDGVVFNYILALRQKDFNRAYGYLSEGEYKPTMVEFKTAMLNNQSQIELAIVDIRETTIDGNNAVVQVVSLNQYNDGIFSSGYENPENAALEKVAGDWKIQSMPYLFWDYSWYNQDYK